MLEHVDLALSLSDAEWKKRRRLYRQRLYDLEKAAFDAGVATIVLFEGWDAAGKGTSIRQLTARLDPRGFVVHPIRAARTYEKRYPWLWRFWLKLPNYGQVAIFDRSWYGRVLVERVEKLAKKAEWQRAYNDIVEFERLLANDGYVMIKFFLHISQKEQRRRFKAVEADPLEAWHITEEDWDHHRRYDEWLVCYEEMLERTDTSFGPWTIVPATNRRYMLDTIYHTLIGAMSDRLEDLDALPPEISVEEAEADEVEMAKAAKAVAGEATDA
jgi:polyphosphate kinase 2 (PPK2 family)